MSLRVGSSRCVFLVGTVAIKVPVFWSWRRLLWGLLANMSERQFNTLHCPELCPLIFSLPGGFINVMRRARVMTEEEFDRFCLVDYEKWANGFKEIDLPVEMKHSSFGHLDGKVVAVDYG